MSYLELASISHYYFNEKHCTHALDNISFQVEKGHFISLLGPSGCGKTTLLSIIAQLISPTEGTIKLKGLPIDQHNISIGYMLQQDYLFPWKTILDNVCIGPKIRREWVTGDYDKAKALLAKVGLTDVVNKYPDQLSGGMRQRVALARTLMTDPALLLLDEPFSALDFQTKLILEAFMSAMLKDYQKTSLLVTHDIGEAIAMSDDIFLMRANPGSIHLHIPVPEHVRNLSPIEARKHPEYHQLFDQIWKEMNQLDTENDASLV
ncbi:ABC transporter ATP-binding protein [Amphibacillus jilinensis]|uniref:ABC transporter ATP-binding protein n=1 Tax=Amphibacillus jilinensis TaxID=1216008 RepID=UPI00031EF5F4|nr:ABC transporter ATP-binding protein [Amphibacillus jilinensis]